MTQEGRTPKATQEVERNWLTPGVRGIGLASFLSDVGHEILLHCFLAYLSVRSVPLRLFWDSSKA